jgi:hypothetical protein
MRALLKRLIAGAATLTALAIGLFGAIPLQAQDALTATLQRAAVLPIARPRNPNEVYLDLWVKAYTPPRRGAVEAIVTVGPARQKAQIEVGRFAVFPSEPFIATEASQQRAYRFNASAALGALKTEDTDLTIRVALVSLIETAPAEGAQLVLAKAAFSESSDR